MNKTDDDILLFERVRNNDRFALNVLFARYYNALCQFADSILRNPEEAEETVADVFFVLWKNRERLQITTSVRAYIYTATRHAALARLKKSKLNTLPIDAVSPPAIADTSDPEQAYVFQELEAHVQAAIATLPPRCRQVYELSRIESRSYHEIAMALQISEKTVENHLLSAFTAIRAYVRKHHAPAVTHP